MGAGLPEAYKECRRLTGIHSKTWHFSARFLPGNIRNDVFAIHGFTLYPDEMSAKFERDEYLAALSDFRSQTELALNGERPSLLVLRAFADTLRRHKIPHELPMSFLDALDMDARRADYSTYADLQTYMLGRSSATVEMICHVIGAQSADAAASAVDFGTAIQLTRFWREIGSDWTTRRKVYVPLEDLKRFHLGVQDISAMVTDDRWWALMKYEIARARRYFAKADKLIPHAPGQCRFSLSLTSQALFTAA